MLTLNAETSDTYSAFKDNSNYTNFSPADGNDHFAISNDLRKFDKRGKDRSKEPIEANEKINTTILKELEVHLDLAEEVGPTKTAFVNYSKCENDNRILGTIQTADVIYSKNDNRIQGTIQTADKKFSINKKRDKNIDTNLQSSIEKMQFKSTKETKTHEQPRTDNVKTRNRKHRAKKLTNRERGVRLTEAIEECTMGFINEVVSLAQNMRYERFDISLYLGNKSNIYALARFAHNPYVVFPTLVAILRSMTSVDHRQSGCAESRADSSFLNPLGVSPENAIVPEDDDMSEGYVTIVNVIITSMHSDCTLSRQDPTYKNIKNGILAEKVIVSEAWHLMIETIYRRLQNESTDLNELLKKCYTYGRVSHDAIIKTFHLITEKMVDTLQNPPALDLGQFLYDKIIEDVLFDQGNKESIDQFMASMILDYQNETQDIEFLAGSFDRMTTNPFHRPSRKPRRKRNQVLPKSDITEMVGEEEEEEEEEDEEDLLEFFDEEGWFDDWW